MPTRSNGSACGRRPVVLQRAGDVIRRSSRTLRATSPAILDLPDALPECDSDAVREEASRYRCTGG